MNNKIKSKVKLSTDQDVSFKKLYDIDSFRNYVDVRKHQYNDELLNYLLNSRIITTNEVESMFNVIQLNDIVTDYSTISKSYQLRFKNKRNLSSVLRNYVFSTLIRNLRNDDKLTFIYKLKEQIIVIFFIDDEIEISESEMN